MIYSDSKIITKLSLIFIFFIFVLSIPAALNAATITVDEAIDDDPAVDNGSCSLREAVISGNTNTSVDTCNAGESDPVIDEIVFDPSLDNTPVTLSIEGSEEDASMTGDLDIFEDVVLLGNGTVTGSDADITTIAGVRSDRVFHIRGGANVGITGVTISGGGSVDVGGGIRADGNLTLTESVITDNIVTSTGFVSGAGISSTGDLVILNTEIIGNNAESEGGNVFGGGIHWSSEGTLNIENSRISENSATKGMGGTEGTITAGGGARILIIDTAVARIVNSEISANTLNAGQSIAEGGGLTISSSGTGMGSLTITNSTISGNEVVSTNPSSERGGGIHYFGEAGFTFEMVNVTVAFNEGADIGGVRESGEEPVVLSNTIIADNTGDVPDCSGDFVSGGWNLIGDNTFCNFTPSTGDQIGDVEGGDPPVDPLLAPLADNGGTTLTHALLDGSPAIDTADPADPAGAGTCETEDQRGEMRPFDGDDDGTAVCDIGAFELQTAAIPPVSADGGNGCAITDTGTENSHISGVAILIFIPAFAFLRRKYIRIRNK